MPLIFKFLKNEQKQFEQFLKKQEHFLKIRNKNLKAGTFFEFMNKFCEMGTFFEFLNKIWKTGKKLKFGFFF